ncbi:7769_t:CDS:1, partial [Racocetra persica]
TIFTKIYNHELNLKICKYSTKFWAIGKDMLNDIKFYTKNRNLSISIQCKLLSAKYLDRMFTDSDLANAIQYFKVKFRDYRADTSYLLSFFTEKQSEESE